MYVNNAKVVILGSNKDRLDNKIKNLSAKSDKALGFVCDVLNNPRVEEVCDKIIKQWGQIDVLLNAAGGNMPGGTITEEQTIFDLKLDDFKKVTNLNLDGTLIPSLVFGKAMVKNGCGVIINYSSMAAIQGTASDAQGIDYVEISIYNGSNYFNKGTWAFVFAFTLKLIGIESYLLNAISVI